MLMQGKKGIIVGLANKKSIAYGIAKSCFEQGAELMFTYKDDRRKLKLEKLITSFNTTALYKLNATNDEDYRNLQIEIKKDFGKIDFIVHSIASTTKGSLSGGILKTTSEDMNFTMDVSVTSLLKLTNSLLPILNEKASIVALSYLGAERVIPNYNLMGVAKAALEATVRYMAIDLGKMNIRINSLSAGPIKTLAASGIGDFSTILKWNEANSPLRRNVSVKEVGNSALYLLSDLSSGVTGQVHYVDGGYNITGMAAVDIDEDGNASLAWNNIDK